MKVLYIAASTPYDSVGHAGGQTFNFYIKKMSELENVEVSLVSYCSEEEYNIAKEELSDKIDKHLIVRHKDIKTFIGNILSINSKINPWHKYCNIMTYYASKLLIDKLKELRKMGYKPDVIIMEWTQILLQISTIKNIFPEAVYVASEHDVAYLGLKRKQDNSRNIIEKIYKNIQKNNIFRRELEALQQCDIIMPHNDKDGNLLIKDGIDSRKVFSLIPYYHKVKLEYARQNNDIIFFGYMRRIENITAAKWFVENVMPRLKDLDVRFNIIGGGVTEELKSLESDKVHVQGFVPEVDPFFSAGMCFAAPLILGAGIKVKILEAMSSGIPVLTNEIGIEGIPADKEKDYYHCNKPEEYEKIIREIYNNEIQRNGKAIVEEKFNYELFFDSYYKRIERELF